MARAGKWQVKSACMQSRSDDVILARPFKAGESERCVAVAKRRRDLSPAFQGRGIRAMHCSREATA